MGKLFEQARIDSADREYAVELLHLRVLVDNSVIEVFANDRQAALRRIYPSHTESAPIKLFSEGGATRVHSLTAWEVMPANPY